MGLSFLVVDVLRDRARLPHPRVVLDRGVLHTFTTEQGQAQFAAAVPTCCRPVASGSTSPAAPTRLAIRAIV